VVFDDGDAADEEESVRCPEDEGGGYQPEWVGVEGGPGGDQHAEGQDGHAERGRPVRVVSGVASDGRLGDDAGAEGEAGREAGCGDPG